MKNPKSEIRNPRFLVRPNILALAPYRCARDDYDSGILLDANENSNGPNIPGAEGLNRYPSPYQWELKEKIGAFRGVPKENIFVGVGSDEPIDLLIRVFCEPGTDAIVITPPTYGMYKVAASINNVPVVSIPLTPDFQLKTDDILAASTEKTKILFLCSPNNPTGNDLNHADIERLIREFPGIVVVDEAYIDFSDKPSFASRVTEFENLVVLQTLSKSFGLAGIRLGIAFASTEVIGFLSKIKAPYNINQLTSDAAIKAFEHLDEMKRSVQELIEQRRFLETEFAKIPQVEKIYPSDSNFILIRVPNALHIYRTLPNLGVVIRYRGDQIHCEETLRITVGTAQENRTLVEAFKQVLAT
ncbi:histidinol-phosphate transaminase [bacterium]|nr:MAG: histidinol-phosphate transaminase [bacterium]